MLGGGVPLGGTTGLEGISIVQAAGEKIYGAHLRSPRDPTARFLTTISASYSLQDSEQVVCGSTAKTTRSDVRWGKISTSRQPVAGSNPVPNECSFSSSHLCLGLPNISQGVCMKNLYPRLFFNTHAMLLAHLFLINDPLHYASASILLARPLFQFR
jgi:hypothetical protein